MCWRNSVSAYRGWKHDLASYEQRKIEAQIYKGFTLRLFMEFQAVGNVIALFQIFFFQNIPSRVGKVVGREFTPTP